jgi:exopolyphosphatase/guanosine-5'-triphosphate,3'-diphosphate pyrophosphatase
MSNVAVLDCGSNSTRLLIASREGATLVREMRITRLSAGVDASAHLGAEARERTYDALTHYRALMDEHHVERGLLVATSAVRDAANARDFLQRAEEITGVPARVLSGEEEAEFTYAGATNGLAADPRATVVLDIGGGSTEIAVRLGGLHSYSMQLGCVRVSERALGAGVVTPAGVAATRVMIEKELDRAWVAVPLLSELAGAARLVGVAGTVSTLAQLDARRRDYDRAAVHHRVLARATVAHWRDLLGALAPPQRLELPGMVPGREDVLVAGLHILDAVMGRLEVDELLTSEDDILDGVAASLT